MADEEKKYVITIKPASTAEHAARFELSPEQLGQTIEKIIKYGVYERHIPRKQQVPVDRIKEEMTGEYGITLNDTAVKPTDTLAASYFKEETLKNADGTPILDANNQARMYLGATLIVAAKQKGGLELATSLYDTN